MTASAIARRTIFVATAMVSALAADGAQVAAQPLASGGPLSISLGGGLGVGGAVGGGSDDPGYVAVMRVGLRIVTAVDVGIEYRYFGTPFSVGPVHFLLASADVHPIPTGVMEGFYLTAGLGYGHAQITTHTTWSAGPTSQIVTGTVTDVDVLTASSGATSLGIGWDIPGSQHVTVSPYFTTTELLPSSAVDIVCAAPGCPTRQRPNFKLRVEQLGFRFTIR